MTERNINGFKLTSAVVTCPECNIIFRKELLIETPPLTAEDVVEADLHRVFPDPCIRGSLLALCPECKYCAWSTSFPGMNLNPLLAKSEPALPHTKKYALAVKCARVRNVHPLDIAFIAINGLWCAREAGEDDQLWLELVAYEHARGMTGYPSREGEDGMAHLMMAEVWRQLKQFDRARREYEDALKDPAIMPEIIRHQIGLCDRKVSGITVLPLHVVRQVFAVEEELLPAEASCEPQAALAADCRPPLAQAVTVAAETAMLSAISSLLSAQAALLAQEQPAEIEPLPPASVMAPQNTAAVVLNAAQPSVHAAPVDCSAGGSTAVPGSTTALNMMPGAATGAITGAGKAELEPPSKNNLSVAGRPDLLSHQPRNIAGLKRVAHGNALPQARHSHKFRHPDTGLPRIVNADGWASDYAAAAPSAAQSATNGLDKCYGQTAELADNPYYEPVQRSALPDFDIEDPAGLAKHPVRNPGHGPAVAPVLRSDREQSVQQDQASTRDARALPDDRQSGASSASTKDHSDAIARVESYLSFSRALQTRSFLKYN